MVKFLYDVLDLNIEDTRVRLDCIHSLVYGMLDKALLNGTLVLLTSVYLHDSTALYLFCPHSKPTLHWGSRHMT